MSALSHALPQALQSALSEERIPGLDGLRGLAAIAIILTHMKLAPFWVALNLFFGLSGFLITWLLLVEEEREGRVSFSAFHVRRVMRIMPAYYVAVLAVVWLTPESLGKLSEAHLDSTLFYLSNYYQAMHGPTHGALSPFWSLALEEQFYLIWPLLFIISRGYRVPLLGLAIGGVWWQRWVVVWQEGHFDWAYHAADTRADHILVGCLLAIGLHKGVLPWLWRGLCARRLCMGFTLGPLAVLTLIPLIYGEAYRLGLAFYLEPWFIAGLLVQVIACSANGGLAWLQHDVLRWLGHRSYALYLYHVLAMFLVQDMLPAWTPWSLALPSLLLALFFSELSWRLVESPSQALRRAMLAKVKG